jgi:inorganic triphosphatase YgiF
MQPQEIELKLVILRLSGEDALKQLRRSPSLARRAMSQHWLENRYFDTPDGQLQQHRCALRLRQTLPHSATPGTSPATSWIQTLKTAGHSQGGLSQRGEWETPVIQARLDREALRGTAWDALDPNDAWFSQLQPLFETRCLRTTWQVRRKDGTHIEVALDAGEVLARGRTAPFVELELESKSGAADTLFELAEELAKRVPVLPSNRSKAERGQALWADRLLEPAKARPLQVSANEPVATLVVRAMEEMLDQFSRNLDNLMQSDESEIVHQARVGWRRWRSMHKLLRPWLDETPDTSPLKPLLEALGHQRNLDVACTETLPFWAPSWPGDATVWLDSVEQLQHAREQHRSHLRDCLADPQVGLALLHWAQALWQMNENPLRLKKRDALERLARWHRRMRALLHPAHDTWIDVASLHKARLLAKRLRYGSEALASALPARKQRRVNQWMSAAQSWQTRIGQARDAWQAAECLQAVGGSEAMAYFLKGVGAAMDRSAQEKANQR